MNLIRLYQKGFGFIIRKINYRQPKCINDVYSYEHILEIIQNKHCMRPFIVASNRTLRQERFKIIKDNLPLAIYFNEINHEPTDIMVEKMVDEYRFYQCDCVIAIGGGSIIDASKALLARIVRPNKKIGELKGILKIRKKIPLFICVPTTAGTGSEASITTVIKDAKTHQKYTINDPCLICHYAFLDPTLTYTLSSKQTICYGMDALCHGFEAYLNKPYHRKNTKKNCLQVIKLIMYYLPIACKNPDNYKARNALLLASYQAGRCFSEACVGNVHALAHSIGGKYNLAHGELISILLPVILKDMQPAIEEELNEVADYVGFDDSNDLIEHLIIQNQTMGIPNKIKELQIQDFDKLALQACHEANPLYPVPVIYNKNHFKSILKQLI